MKAPWRRILSTCSISCIIAIIWTCVSVNTGLSQTSKILDKVVARVGSEYILYSDIQELYSYAKEKNPAYDESLQCQIIEQLIAKKLLIDQARLDSIEISDIELEVELQRRIDYILSTMGGNEEVFHDYYGKTPLEQKEIMRESLKETMIEQRIQNQLIQNINITPKEVIDFFERIPPDSIPYQNAEVELGEISMKTMLSDEVKNAAREKITELRKRIVEGGESFQELASVYSDDPGSAKSGGDLGWTKRGSFVPEFEAESFSLDPGEVSDIVETKFGYHIIQMNERRGNNINVRHILIKPEVTEEDIERTKHFLDSITNLIAIDSLPFGVAVKRFSDKDAQSFSNAGRMINPETGDTFWETSQLPYQIYFAIEDVDVNGTTDILEFEERGEKIFKVFQLQSKTRPHKLSISTDFSRIQNYAKENKKSEYFNDWMEKKIRDTYIEIIENYASCQNLQKYGVNIRP